MVKPFGTGGRVVTRLPQTPTWMPVLLKNRYAARQSYAYENFGIARVSRFTGSSKYSAKLAIPAN
jgi:hypothetical protein